MVIITLEEMKNIQEENLEAHIENDKRRKLNNMSGLEKVVKVLTLGSYPPLSTDYLEGPYGGRWTQKPRWWWNEVANIEC